MELGVQRDHLLGVRRRALTTDKDSDVGKAGRGDWIRTSDPHTPSVMRYQAALRPDQGCGI
jgi:hypothetical protein